MDTALYFPYIRVPETSWFTQVLLYWDRAASIVPYRMWGDENELGPYMSQLIKAGLVQAIPAGEVPLREYLFDSIFLDDLPDPAYPTDTWRWTRLYSEKGSEYLFDTLMGRGLARPSHGDWYEVEERTAGLYVAYLAGSFCGINHDMFPVTDKSEILAGLTQPIDNTASRLAEWRYATITQALPMPSHTVPPLELARFKEHYGDELRRLRTYLNGKLIDLATTDDEYALQVKKERILQEIRDDVARLTEQMSRRRWPRTILVGVGGVVAAGLTTGAVIATGGSALAFGLGIAGSAAALGPAAYQASDVIRSPRIDLREPLAYAALAGAL
jgi:hypothetical protein